MVRRPTFPRSVLCLTTEQRVEQVVGVAMLAERALTTTAAAENLHRATTGGGPVVPTIIILGPGRPFAELLHQVVDNAVEGGVTCMFVPSLRIFDTIPQMNTMPVDQRLRRPKRAVLNELPVDVQLVPSANAHGSIWREGLPRVVR